MDNGSKPSHRKGLVIVNTGNGKGKTTAALGMVLRAWGQGLRVGIFQFIKHQGARFGEVLAVEKMGIQIESLGDGFTWNSKDIKETRRLSLQAWELVQGYICSGDYDLIVLDEFTYLFQYNWLDALEVIAWLVENKPDDLHLVITGRNAPEPLLRYADLATEMVEVKHPYKKGIKAQVGIEY